MRSRSLSRRLVAASLSAAAIALAAPAPAISADNDVPPEPAVKDLSLTMVSLTPLGRGTFVTDGEELPLLVPAGTTPEALGLSEVNPLGYVGRAGAIAPVFWTGELSPVAGGKAQAAVLEVRDLTGVGEYKGSIDLLPSQEGGEVGLTISVTDAIWWAALALLIGIVAALAVKRFIGVKRLRSELRQRLAEINSTFARAKREFTAQSVGQPFTAYRLSPAFTAAGALAEQKIRNISRFFGIGIDSDQHDNLNALLGSMRTAADSWQQFGDDLAGLAMQLTELDAALPDDGERDIWPAGAPKVVDGPSKLLNGHTFEDLAKYAERQGEVSEAVDLLAYWDSLRGRLLEYRALQERLLSGQPSDSDRLALDGLFPDMREVANELWSATTESELAERESNEDLLRIEKVLSRFELPVATDSDGGSTARVLVARTGLQVATPGGPRAERERSEDEWAAAAKSLRRRRFLLDLLVAAGALGLALFAGLNALYFGKEFGTEADYLNAFLWGGTTEGALAGLLVVLERIGPARDSLPTTATLPQLASGPSGGTRG